MELRVRKNGEIHIIDVSGEMDLNSSYRLRELIMKLLDTKADRFVINLHEVDYMDSSGIGALIYICSTLKKTERSLAIANIRPSVMKVMELTKLTGYFPISATMEDALKAVGSRG